MLMMLPLILPLFIKMYPMLKSSFLLLLHMYTITLSSPLFTPWKEHTLPYILPLKFQMKATTPTHLLLHSKWRQQHQHVPHKFGSFTDIFLLWNSLFHWSKIRYISFLDINFSIYFPVHTMYASSKHYLPDFGIFFHV